MTKAQTKQRREPIHVELLKRQRHTRRLLLIFSAVLALLFLLSLCLGRFAIQPREIWQAFFGDASQLSSQVTTVLYRIRLPRILAAMAVGAALAVAGSVYQGLFRNPLVSPDILGTSQGAGFGAALGILLQFSYWPLTGLAFISSLGAVFLTYLCASRVKRDKRTGFILAGIMVGSIFTAGLSFLKLIADPTDELPSITYWLMGSFANIRREDLPVLLPLLLLGFLPLFILRYRLNLSTLTEMEAQSMGINLPRLRLIIIISSTLLSATCVAFTGLVGWVGLVVPHLARKLVGPSYVHLLPTAGLCGAILMLLVDDICRNLFTGELPLSIVTALIGAPFFLYLIQKKESQA